MSFHKLLDLRLDLRILDRRLLQPRRRPIPVLLLLRGGQRLPRGSQRRERLGGVTRVAVLGEVRLDKHRVRRRRHLGQAVVVQALVCLLVRRQLAV